MKVFEAKEELIHDIFCFAFVKADLWIFMVDDIREQITSGT